MCSSRLLPRCVGGESQRAAVVARILLLGVGRPFGEILGRDRMDFNRHEGMVDAADLVALAVIDAGPLDLEPGLVDAAGHRVFLHADRRHEPAVDDVGAVTRTRTTFPTGTTITLLTPSSLGSPFSLSCASERMLLSKLKSP